MHLAKMWQAELRKISDIVEMIESIAMDVELLLRHCNPILAFIEFIENEYKISWYLEDFMGTDGFVWNNNQSAAGSEVLVGYSAVGFRDISCSKRCWTTYLQAFFNSKFIRPTLKCTTLCWV